MSCAPAGRARGFTLTECCVAVAIAAVVGALAVPSFVDSIERRTLLGRSAELQADLQWLRTEAVARQEAVGITLGPGGDCYVLHTGAAGSCACHADSPPACKAPARFMKRVVMPAQGPVRLSSEQPGATFHPVRGNVEPMLTLVLSDTRGRSVRHAVSTLGRVRACALPVPLGGHAKC
jgi:type IV fimbrial biogenesis protein FimT